MSAVYAADSGNMVSFPAEFPFVKRKTEPAPQPAEPVEEIVAPAWQEPTAEAVAPAVGPVEHAGAQVAPAVPVTPAMSLATAEPAPAPVSAVMLPAVTMAPAPSPVRLIERRKVKRDPMSAGALVHLDNFHGSPMKVSLMDISVAGVRFRSAQGVECGEKAQIRIEVGPLRWTTRLRIVHCEREADGTKTIGCAFLRTELLRPWPATAA
jgi:hypothetical protein